MKPLKPGLHYAPGTYKVTVSGLNVRLNPSITSPVKTVLRKGTTFTVSQTSHNWGYIASLGGWCNIAAVYCAKIRELKMLRYTAKKGDSLSKLAKEFNISVAELINLNRIKQPSLLTVGQVLQIPLQDRF